MSFVYILDLDLLVLISCSWLYILYLAMDANFRLKLKDRHIKNDPELGPGWVYCVSKKPYQEEMEKYGDQIEVVMLHVSIVTCN